MAFCIKCGHPAEMVIPAGDTKQRLVCTSCGHIHYENPNIICGSLLTFDGKVLLCRRAIEPQYGYWTIPAGFMEIGETVSEGAARETYEEAEASPKNQTLYCIYDIPQIGHVNMFYVGALKDGCFGMGSESLECALFAEKDIPWDDIAFITVTKTLKYYFEDRKKHALDNMPLHSEVIKK